MKLSFLWIPCAIAIFGCTEDRAAGGGGFETGDLQARVTTPSGKPAAKAQVWLVRSNGNSGPATVVDSAWTNSSGVARLAMPTDIDRSKLGLDARMDDSMGIVHLPFLRGDSAEVHLGSTGSVEAWIDSTRRIPSIFVPGSHFASARSESAPKSVLRLPYGHWEVVLEGAQKAGTIQRVEIGSSVAVLGGLAWSNKNLDWTDSIVLDKAFTYRYQYRDPSFAFPGTWVPLDSNLAGYAMSPELMEERNGALVLRMGATSFSDKAHGSGATPPPLPAAGSMVFAWQFDRPPASDSDLVRVISIEDSMGAGFRVELDPRRMPSEWITYAAGASKIPSVTETVVEGHLLATEWTLSWDQKYFYLWAEKSLLACGYNSGKQGAPKIRIGVRGASATSSGQVAIAWARLYQPK